MTMTSRAWILLSLIAGFIWVSAVPPAPGCCPAGKKGSGGAMPVVNADQTVIIIWDPATQTEHFIRKASFKSAGDEFGFIVPTPYQPELEESGNDAFPYLYDIT